MSGGQWRIPVNGEWFYGTKEQCERERTEYESTFTALDLEEAGVVLAERIFSAPPVPAEDLAELREYHANASRKLKSYADDEGLRGSDVKHYTKRAEFHDRAVALLDRVKELNP